MKLLFSKYALSLSVLAALLLSANAAFAGEWTQETKVIRRGTIVVSYRAKLEGDVLLVEARHAPMWHTYSMDNPLRAQKATGKERPDTELPTRFEVSGLELIAPWYQTQPKDMTQKEISWYTWGFEGTARFATKVGRVAGASSEATITINAQACDASSCQMVQNVIVTLPLTNNETKTNANPLEGLVKVAMPNKE